MAGKITALPFLMNDNETLAGEFVRILMDNHRKSTPTRKQSVRAQLKVGLKEMGALVELSKGYLEKLGLELVGIGKEGVIDPMTAEKYFIRRIKPSPATEKFLPEETQRLILAFTFLILERKVIEVPRLWFFMQKTGVFESEDDFAEFLNQTKRQGYLFVTKVEESLIITPGWRYHCDFHNFDPKGYFRNNGH
ncbi:hypothetical protein EROM_050350 [Encephalitozoon romaleae SJ-2008]|uniref:MAGE domain-containing protein n=1 Tax=Encephalitozoon romaleae (strain SJ-2008) TaxID=1178016 RepID=I6ZIB9_ENCRO|nr:hypothetical protein EROM_050350 [Encephalitozoon romaleae SJ-2008]AFN82968.1 hypothetical protein EROM_050350 [Encephalitozoon romaleae SJ-2008]